MTKQEILDILNTLPDDKDIAIDVVANAMGYYLVRALHRNDIAHLGYDPHAVDDGTLREIAGDIEEDM